MNMRVIRRCVGAVLTALVAIPAFTLAQDAVGDVVEVNRGPGIELALFGGTVAVQGHAINLQGIAYEVRELADLHRLAQASVKVSLYADAGPRTPRVAVVERTATSDANGNFSIALDVPVRALSAPQLVVTVSHRGLRERRFEFDAQVRSPLALDVATDRVLYQQGEIVHVWARVFDLDSRQPEARRELHFSCTNAAGTVVGESTTTSSNAGTGLFDIALAPTAAEGQYAVIATIESGGTATTVTKQFRVGRRTVERVMLSAQLEQNFVRPAGTLRGRVSVRTPSGAPIRNARVEIRIEGRDEPFVFQTDSVGIAAFEVQAPAYLSGDVAEQNLDIRAIHPAHGALRTLAPYRLTRAPYSVSMTESNGALVPELNSIAYILVEAASGEPAPAGVTLVARGPAFPNGSVTVQTDAHGLAALPVRIQRNSAAAPSVPDGSCGTGSATSFEIEIRGTRTMSARVSACVAPEADVIPHVVTTAVEPGSEIVFDLQRRARATGRVVLVEALSAQGDVVATAWVEANATRGTIRLPANIQGVVKILARALVSDNVSSPLDEHSPAMAGVGMSDAVLVRPDDAFSLQVETPADPVQVRSHARIGLRTSATVQHAYATLLVRDVAAHGGEQPWSRSWIGEELDAAAVAPTQAAHDLFLRTSLAATLSAGARPIGVAPLNPRPWEEEEAGQVSVDTLRDPLVNRAELVRRGIGTVMRSIEGALSELGSTPEELRGLVVRNGNRSAFDPQIVDTLVNQGTLNDTTARTLGAARMRVEMLTRADASFTFDNVAKRIARARLVQLMRALVVFTDPDNTRAAREVSGEPPERWLSKMLDRGRITAEQLVDPWGHPFVFRRASGTGPRIVIAEAAPLYELVSAGPDGSPGTADDVRDPFERIVARGTPYAVASGEDQLMQSLSTVSAGETVLENMLTAYESIGILAREEQIRGVVAASASELDGDMISEMEGTIGLGRIGTIGHGGGSGSGSGYGSGAGGFNARYAAAPSVQRAQGESAYDFEDDLMQGDLVRPDAELLAHQLRAAAQNGTSQMGETIRERFPATLFFVGEVPLDASGATVVDVPVADALTTYRVEAIAWTGSGWITSAHGDLRVDQEANVDAPVPTFATVGDVVRVPVRVGNRTGHALTARIEVVAENGLTIAAPAPQTVEIAPRDAAVVVLPITLQSAGIGSLIVRAVRASDGTPLDAVRRPMRVLADARLVRVSHETFFRGDNTYTIHVPADASARSASELRITRGALIFNDLQIPNEHVNANHSVWALRVGGQSIPDSLRELTRSILNSPYVDERGVQAAPLDACFAVMTGYDDASISDAHIEAALLAISSQLPTEDAIAQLAPTQRPTVGSALSQFLVALAPAAQLAGTRPALREDLMRVITRLRGLVETYAPLAEEAPDAWANTALALLLLDPTSSRAIELMRRVDARVIRTGETALLDPDSHDMHTLARVSPTATVALLHVLRNDPENAMPFVRELVALRGAMARWDSMGHAIAAATMLRMSANELPASVVVNVDGERVELHPSNGVIVASLPRLETPGDHVIHVQSGEHGAVLAFLDVRYGRPWTSADRPAAIDVTIDGQLGARDGRAALQLQISNRGARLLGSPVVEIDLPSGTEIDEQTQERLTAITGVAPTIEERTLRLTLHSLAPGARLRIPLALRWSLAGSLRGLGVTAFDASTETDASGLRPSRIVASRLIEIADHGAEPTPTDPESISPPPAPPEPIPPIRPLGPVAQVSQ